MSDSELKLIAKISAGYLLFATVILLASVIQGCRISMLDNIYLILCFGFIVALPATFEHYFGRRK